MKIVPQMTLLHCHSSQSQCSLRHAVTLCMSFRRCLPCCHVADHAATVCRGLLGVVPEHILEVESQSMGAGAGNVVASTCLRGTSGGVVGEVAAVPMETTLEDLG